jgi:hypothetical protein
VKDYSLDVRRLYEHVTFADSYGEHFFVFVDGTYLLIEDGQTYLKQRKKHIINALPDTNAINLFLKNYDKENWSNDPQQLEIKKQELQMKKEELELKKKEFENNNW